jgi:holo-[acyl-carrier protein] synthase
MDKNGYFFRIIVTGGEMIDGVGIDIVSIEEFRALVNDKFILRYFSKNEKNLKIDKLAGRFAAREALFKAMKNQKKFRIEDVEITLKGKPQFVFKNGMANSFAQYKIHLSISNLTNYSIAIVIIENIV